MASLNILEAVPLISMAARLQMLYTGLLNSQVKRCVYTMLSSQ